MRKLLSFVLIAGLVAMVAGCGQQAPEVKSSVPQPSGLTIRGTVRALDPVDATNALGPLEGVVLTLGGQSDDKSATTDSNGDYAFEGLPEGTYNVTATKEGYQKTVGAAIALGQGNIPTSDNSEKENDIGMLNTPVVLSISPQPGITVEAAAQTITVVFNEAMDPSSVRPILTCQGIRTFAIADTQNLATSWSADNKTLTASTGALSANLEYRFDLGDDATDAAGNALDATGGTATGGGGLLTALYTAVDYRTASGGAPGAPTGIVVTVNDLVTFDYGDAITGGNSVDLSWLAPTSGQVSGYKVYVATGSSGPWYQLGAAVTANILASGITAVNTALYGALYNPECLDRLAFVTDPVYFSVVAYNAEGETAGTTVSTRDATAPTVATATETIAGVPAELAAAFTDYSATNKGCYVLFSEPMNVSTLTTAAKYTVSTGGTVTPSVVYNNAGVCIVRLTWATAITPGLDTVRVAVSGPTDLSGNDFAAVDTDIIN